MKKFTIILVVLTGALFFAACGTNRGLSKQERRAEYAQFLDSVIMSDNFTFRPNSYKLEPAGKTQQILNSNYRIEFRSDYIEINIPYYRGVTPPYRRAMMNHTLLTVDDYTVMKENDNEIIVKFSSAMFGSDNFTYTLTVSKRTGSAELTLRSAAGPTTSYTGTIIAVY